MQSCWESLRLRHIDASVANWRRVVLNKNTGRWLEDDKNAKKAW